MQVPSSKVHGSLDFKFFEDQFSQQKAWAFGQAQILRHIYPRFTFMGQMLVLRGVGLAKEGPAQSLASDVARAGSRVGFGKLIHGVGA